MKLLINKINEIKDIKTAYEQAGSANEKVIQVLLNDEIKFVEGPGPMGFLNGSHKSNWNYRKIGDIKNEIKDILVSNGLKYQLIESQGMWHTELTVVIESEPKETSGGSYISTSGNEISFDWKYEGGKYHTSKVSYGNGEMNAEDVNISANTLHELENEVVSRFKYKG